MPLLVSKVALRLRVRQAADMEPPDDFVSDTEVDGHVQKSWEKLYAYLVAKYESYFTKHASHWNIKDYETNTVGFTAGIPDYYFPASYWKLIRMAVGSTMTGGRDDENGNDLGLGPWRDLKRAEWDSEHQLNSNDRTGKPTHYILGGRNDYAAAGARAESFRLLPAPDAAYPLRLTYVPIPPDIDSINSIFGADEYVVLDAAIKCLRKEESDIAPLMLERKDWMATVEGAFIHRDVGQAAHIVPSGGWQNEDWEELGY